jgi:flagellar protein FliO/FliZ
VLALAVPPLAGQAKVTGGAAGSAVVAPIDESKTLLAGSESTAAPGGTSDAAGGAAAAPGGAAAAGAPTTGGGVSTWDFVRMLLILAAVVAVIYVLFWLLRKGTRGRIQENDLIKVLGSRGLSGSRALHLVEVGSSIYLVGSADGGVQLIAEITDKESIDSVRLKSAEGAPGGKRTFAQILSEIFRPAKRTFSVGEGIGLLKGQRDRLKRL